ncbi:MAG: hybrid sensor histidine kinase/response regulator transcription factor, partial [Bacteroidota bacterium]
QGDGLCYLEADRIISVGLDGFTTVFAVIEDSDGKLWLSTEEGIVSYQSTSREYETFNKKVGVAANEFNRGAGLVASDGNIFFGGASGVTTFSPATLIRTNDYAPDVIITKFTLLGEEVNVKDSTQILDKSIEYTDEISLNYDQNIFSVHFAMPNYINSEKNTYSYRLKGLDDSWTKSVNPFVAFTIQKGGYYEFQVKGINSDGIESENVTQLIIKVRNAPWKTWWAYSIYIILVTVGALIFIFFFQSRLRLKHKLELEEQAFVQQEEINQQKLQFFTNISHEFRTPLTLISGPLEKLILEYKGPSSVFKQLQVIKRNTDQLFKLINELMDFRKLENKQMKLEAAEGNIVRFVNEIFLSFSQQAKIKKAKYTFHSDKNEILIFFDRDKLEKVLFNLLSNAFKYTSSKGKIEVIVEDKSESVWVHVIDNGDGISPDYLDRVFDRFYEIPLLKKRSKAKVGTGIGLAIAKNMMELHKGEVTVTSKVGEGSTFTVKLKKGRKHLEDEDLLQSFKNSEDITHYKSQSTQEMMLETEELFFDEEPAESKEKTILIVEDNPEISGFMKSILDKFYNIICAENGAVGFQRSLSEQPDLILSDLMMPVMDGTEFCSKIKSDVRTSHIPFVLLTARTSLVYKYDGLESGADEYLTKPFKIKEVLLKCNNIINTQDHLKKKFASSGEIPSSNITVNSIDETMMNQAIAIIRNNISNEFLNIPMLCAELGVSRSLLFTKFKSWTNQTPNEFILKARMRHAASLIEQNKTNISQIAYKVGLKSPNYFSKLFKKHYSLSPKEYAKKFKSSLGME